MDRDSFLSGGGFFCGGQGGFEVWLLRDFLDVLDVGYVVVLVDDEDGAREQMQSLIKAP